MSLEDSLWLYGGLVVAAVVAPWIFLVMRKRP